MSGQVLVPDSPVGKLMDCFDSKQAPAHIGKPVFEKHLKYLEYAGIPSGIKSFQYFLGKRLNEHEKDAVAVPLVNFGSRKSVGWMPDETRLALFEFKKAFSNCEIQAQIMFRTISPSTEQIMATPLWKAQFAPMAKAFNVTDFALWIPTVHSRFFFEEYEIPMILADQFDTLPMDSSLVRVPGALGTLEGELEADTGTFTEQANTQASYLVESKNNVCHAKITQDLLDDSSPAIIDKYRKEISAGLVRSYERAIINGATGTHIDDDTQAGSAKLFSRAFDGLRKRAFDAETALGANSIIFDNGGDTLNKDTFAELLKRLKCQAADKTDLRYIVGCTSATDLVTGAIPELFTAFNFGSIASNVTGEIPPVFGIKVIESSKIRENLGADGKANNPASETLTCMLLVHVSRYNNWLRQAPRMFASPSLPSSDFFLMTGKARHAFAGTPMGAGNPERNVAMAVNIKTV